MLIRLLLELFSGGKDEVIDTIDKLKSVLESLAPRGKFNTFYAKVFQALRIEVNDEMGALREFLEKVFWCGKGRRASSCDYLSLFGGSDGKEFY